jgi:hypothetical protein
MIKKGILLVAILATSLSFGQNTFPATGNVGIEQQILQISLTLGELSLFNQQMVAIMKI